MAYEIQYCPENRQRYPISGKHIQGKPGRWIVLFLILAAGLWLRFYGIPDFLIPGDPDVTRVAAAEMMDEIQGGASIDHAVTVFCKEILHGAGF